MSVARDRAVWLRDLYRIEGVAERSTLDAMLAHLGSPVITSIDLPPPLRDLYAEPLLLLRRGLGIAWEKWLKAHVIGHRWLHVGNQLEMPMPLVDWQERQSEEFAGWLIWGDPARLQGGLTVTTHHVAETAHVPLECVEKWWRIVSGELAQEPHYSLMRERHWARV